MRVSVPRRNAKTCVRKRGMLLVSGISLVVFSQKSTLQECPTRMYKNVFRECPTVSQNHIVRTLVLQVSSKSARVSSTSVSYKSVTQGCQCPTLHGTAKLTVSHFTSRSSARRARSPQRPEGSRASDARDLHTRSRQLPEAASCYICRRYNVASSEATAPILFALQSCEF